jgi:hypothetical protein
MRNSVDDFDRRLDIQKMNELNYRHLKEKANTKYLGHSEIVCTCALGPRKTADINIIHEQIITKNFPKLMIQTNLQNEKIKLQV